MKIGITIARNRASGEYEVISGPNVSIKEHNSFFKDRENLDILAEDYDFVGLITSSGGMGRRKKLKLPSSGAEAVAEVEEESLI
jgi:hypothetical protein